MVTPRDRTYLEIMSTTTVSRPSLLTLAPIVLVAFGAFSMWVIVTEGYFGFLSLAGREPWGLQLLLDLVLCASFGVAWMAGDARKRRIAIWPYVIATALGGSIGLLAYGVRRSFTPPRET